MDKIILSDGTNFSATSEAEEDILNISVPLNSRSKFDELWGKLTASNVALIQVATSEGEVYGIYKNMTLAKFSYSVENSGLYAILKCKQSSALDVLASVTAEKLAVLEARMNAKDITDKDQDDMIIMLAGAE